MSRLEQVQKKIRDAVHEFRHRGLVGLEGSLRVDFPEYLATTYPLVYVTLTLHVIGPGSVYVYSAYSLDKALDSLESDLDRWIHDARVGEGASRAP